MTELGFKTARSPLTEVRARVASAWTAVADVADAAKGKPKEISCPETGDEVDPKTKWHSHENIFVNSGGAGPRKIPAVIKV